MADTIDINNEDTVKIKVPETVIQGSDISIPLVKIVEDVATIKYRLSALEALLLYRGTILDHDLTHFQSIHKEE